MNPRYLVASMSTAALLLAACGEVPEPIRPMEQTKSQISGPMEPAYPAGPYGFVVGAIIPNISFMGRVDVDGNGRVNDDPAVRISLSDYYNNKDVKVLALMFAAEWCGPCQQEQGELVTSWNKYRDDKAGVAYLEAITESTNRSPADLGTIDRWTKKPWRDYQIGKDGLYLPFPVAVDPTKEALKLGASAIPTQLAISTSDMMIQWFNQGYGKGVLERNINDVLQNTQ